MLPLGGGVALLAAGQAGCLLFAFYTREAETSCAATASGERKKKVWQAGGLAGCQLPRSHTSCLMASFCCVLGLRQLVWLVVQGESCYFGKVQHGNACVSLAAGQAADGARIVTRTRLPHLCCSKKLSSVHLTLCGLLNKDAFLDEGLEKRKTSC